MYVIIASMEMQNLDVILKMTEWSLFISKENHSVLQ